MIKKIKSLFKKKEVKKPNFRSFWASNDFQDMMADLDQHELASAKEAAKEYKLLDKLTQQIVDDLEQSGHCTTFSFESKELRKYAMGKIVDKHIKREFFKNQLKEITDERE